MEQGALVGRGSTAEVFAWGDNQVLKLFLKEWPGDAAHEFRVTKAARDLGAPVPVVDRLVEIDGRQGIIFERITGASMLEMLESRPWRLARYARMMAELHAEIHSHQTTSLPSLKDNLEAAFRQREGIPDSLRQVAIDSLHGLPDGNTVLHGDLHPVNILMSPSGPIVIDWETAKRGDPLADVARTELVLRTASGEDIRLPWLINLARGRFLAVYLTRYRQLRPHSQHEQSAWRIPNAAARLVFENLTEEERRRALVIVREGVERPS